MDLTHQWPDASPGSGIRKGPAGTCRGGGGIGDQRRAILYDFTPMQSPPSLNYAPVVPWHAKQKVRRRIALVGLSALFLALCWGAWSGYLRDRIAFARVWHRSETFAEPPTTPVYTTDPILVPQLLKTGYIPSGYRTPAGPIGAYRRPSTWIDLQSSMQGGCYHYACPFLHSRTAAGQPTRIVAVQVAGEILGPADQQFRVWPEALDWSWPPKPHWPPEVTPTTGLTLWVKRHEPFTVYAGQPDPADSSHFTIGYTAGGKTGTIDGRLKADGTVTLTIRDGPLFGRTEDSFK